MMGLDNKTALRVRFAGFALLPLLLAGVALQLNAQTFTLNNLNSIVSINASSPAGMSSYLVDGVNQVKQQWFYFRIGDSGPNLSIDSIGNLVASQVDPATLDLSYTDLPSSPNYRARVQYLLTGKGSGSGQSILGETVTFYNTSAANLSLRLFDYSDFDVAGALNNDVVTLSRLALGPPSNRSYQTSFGQTNGAFFVNSTAISGTNNSSRFEANYFNQTLQKILNGTPSSLNNNPTATAGDLTAAVEWDVTLLPGTSLQISKTINLVVPEPSSAAMLGLGLVAWVLTRRNKARVLDS